MTSGVSKVLVNFILSSGSLPSAQIWHNSLIRIENKPIFYKSWFTAGVKDVKDILDTDGNSILSYTAFTAKYKIKTNFLEFYKLVSAVKLFRQKCSQQPNRRPKTKTFGQTLLASEKACKTVYKSIMEKKATTPLKSQGKWLSKENIIGNANVNWENTNNSRIIEKEIASDNNSMSSFKKNGALQPSVRPRHRHTNV